MRKVANRLEVLEERYKNLPAKQRAGKINEELMETFCVGEREIFNWKRIVNTANKDVTNICDEPRLLQIFAVKNQDYHQLIIWKSQSCQRKSNLR